MINKLNSVVHNPDTGTYCKLKIVASIFPIIKE